MKGQVTEESTTKLGMIILGVMIVLVLVYILAFGFKGSQPVKAILCSILWLLPGGGVLSAYASCAAIPV